MIIIKEIPEDRTPALYRDTMRNSVHVDATVTRRNSDDKGYTRYGYRLFLDTDSWDNASREERMMFLYKMFDSLAQETKGN